MESTIKTLLILIAFVVITVLLFSSSPEPKKEGYDASFDPKYADPRVSFYSRGITFRPDSNKDIDSTVTDTMMNSDGYATLGTDPDKLFDQLADQALGVATNGDSKDDIDMRQQAQAQAQAQSINKTKQVRFMPFSEEVLNEYKKPAPIRNVVPKSSFYDTDVNVDRVVETNNIINYCVHDRNFDRETIAYTNRVDEGYDLDADDVDNYDMHMANSGLKSFNMVDEDEARFDIPPEKHTQDIDNLKDITTVMNDLRGNALYSIRGDYRSASAFNGGKQMYDKLD